jgi:glycosyltransferase involved in cell wall biosynthesis
MQSDNQPLVTIGLTSFNSAETIHNALLSAVSQTWERTEIIIVDDASEDGSQQKIQELCKRFVGVKCYLLNENKGVANARNLIIEHSLGDFIVFFDDDDVSDKTRVWAQYKRIIDYELRLPHETLVICHTARLQNFGNGAISREPAMGEVFDGDAPNGDALATWFLTGVPAGMYYGAGATCSQMARKNVYQKLGGFDPEFRRSEDTEFNVRLAIEGGHFIGISETLVEQKMTKGQDKGLCNEQRYSKKLLEKHRKFIEVNANFRYTLLWIDLKYAVLKKQFGLSIILLAFLISWKPVNTLMRLMQATRSFQSHLSLSKFHMQTATKNKDVDF